MAGEGEAYPAACGRTEPASACLCAFGKDPYADSRVPLGTRPETDTEPALAAAAALRKDYGKGSGRAAYAGGKRGCVHPCDGSAAGDSGCGRGVLRTVGGPAAGEEPRGVCFLEKGTGPAGLHAAEAERGGAGRTDEGLSFPDGHRYLAAERPGCGTDGEAFGKGWKDWIL